MRCVPTLLLVPLVLAGHTPAFAQKLTTPPAVGAYPSDISFTDEGARGKVYRQAASSLRLYTYDRDLPGQSTCYDSCRAVWPIMPVSAGSKPAGDWTIISRRDGARQWAYRGKPVYLRFHDAPGIAQGDGQDGVWHVIAYSVR